MANPFNHTLRHEWEGLAHKLTVIILPRKTSMLDLQVTVPQTDTGRWGEYPKVLEKTLVKELGKMTP